MTSFLAALMVLGKREFLPTLLRMWLSIVKSADTICFTEMFTYIIVWIFTAFSLALANFKSAYFLHCSVTRGHNIQWTRRHRHGDITLRSTLIWDVLSKFKEVEERAGWGWRSTLFLKPPHTPHTPPPPCLSHSFKPFQALIRLLALRTNPWLLI